MSSLLRARSRLASRVAARKELNTRLLIPKHNTTENLDIDGENLLAHITAKHGRQQEIQLQSLHRLAGATAFAVDDPAAAKELLGIRIECFALSEFLLLSNV